VNLQDIDDEDIDLDLFESEEEAQSELSPQHSFSQQKNDDLVMGSQLAESVVTQGTVETAASKGSSGSKVVSWIHEHVTVRDVGVDPTTGKTLRKSF
jgi:hypothetical protein